MTDLPPRGASEGLSEEEVHPLWKLDRVRLRSVGVDIGSATTHLLFSTLEMRRQASALSSRFAVTKRSVDNASRVHRTPFLARQSLDTEALKEIFKAAYEEAGIRPDELDTGAVIATGDAARKDNADEVARMFAGMAGKFVCASAGPSLEARLAAHGSGAVAASLDGGVALNIDIGGGTTKFALAKDGRIQNVCAMNVGARLITVDDADVVVTTEEGARVVAAHLGIDLVEGKPIIEANRKAIVAAMADAIISLLTGDLNAIARELLILPAFALESSNMRIFFSGGVAEYLDGRETRTFGDLAPILASELLTGVRHAFPQARIELPQHRIRATVIGASQFSAQVSGNTIFVDNLTDLPLRDVPVICIDPSSTELEQTVIARQIKNAFEASDSPTGKAVAIAVRWPHGPAYKKLVGLSRGIAEAARGCLRNSLPLVVVLDCDLAQSVGSLISAELGATSRIICIDGIELENFDYVDMSRIDPIAQVVTVTTKSLIFTG